MDLLVLLSWAVAGWLLGMTLYVVVPALWGSIGDWKRYLRKKHAS